MHHVAHATESTETTKAAISTEATVAVAVPTTMSIGHHDTVGGGKTISIHPLVRSHLRIWNVARLMTVVMLMGHYDDLVALVFSSHRYPNVHTDEEKSDHCQKGHFGAVSGDEGHLRCEWVFW